MTELSTLSFCAAASNAGQGNPSLNSLISLASRSFMWALFSLGLMSGSSSSKCGVDGRWPADHAAGSLIVFDIYYPWDSSFFYLLTFFLMIWIPFS